MAVLKQKTYNKECELFSEYRQTGDKKLRNEIVEKYLYIAQILSKRFVNRGIDYDDIYQVAVLGIIYAVERFAPDRGVAFATYATPTVLGEIRRYFRDKGNFIRVPRALCTLFYRAERIRYSSGGDALTKDELARRLNISVSDLDKAYEVGDTSFIRSLEYEANTDGALSISNVIGSDDSDFLMIEDKDFVEYAMQQLSKEERNVIDKRYFKGFTQQMVADEEGISQMKVSRIEKSVLKKLRDLYFHN